MTWQCINGYKAIINTKKEIQSSFCYCPSRNSFLYETTNVTHMTGCSIPTDKE